MEKGKAIQAEGTAYAKSSGQEKADYVFWKAGCMCWKERRILEGRK